MKTIVPEGRNYGRTKRSIQKVPEGRNYGSRRDNYGSQRDGIIVAEGTEIIVLKSIMATIKIKQYKL